MALNRISSLRQRGAAQTPVRGVHYGGLCYPFAAAGGEGGSSQLWPARLASWLRSAARGCGAGLQGNLRERRSNRLPWLFRVGKKSQLTAPLDTTLINNWQDVYQALLNHGASENVARALTSVGITKAAAHSTPAILVLLLPIRADFSEPDLRRPADQMCASASRLADLLRLLAQKSYPRLTDATVVAIADWASRKLSADNFR